MNVTVETLYFSGAQIQEEKLTPVLGPNRGYPVTHLLAMHYSLAGEAERLDFYFSTELVCVEGKGLPPLWEALTKGQPIDQAIGTIEKITVLPYRTPPDDYQMDPEE